MPLSSRAVLSDGTSSPPGSARAKPGKAPQALWSALLLATREPRRLRPELDAAYARLRALFAVAPRLAAGFREAELRAAE